MSTHKYKCIVCHGKLDTTAKKLTTGLVASLYPGEVIELAVWIIGNFLDTAAKIQSFVNVAAKRK